VHRTAAARAVHRRAPLASPHPPFAAWALALALGACTTPPPGDGATRDPAAASDTGTPAPVSAGTTPGVPATPDVASAPDTSRAALLAHADSAVAAIARRDWPTLATLVHPERGLRVSPYGYLPPAGECTVTLTAAEVAALTSDTTTRCWGHFDGSGEPMRLPWPAYYERFVYDKPYRDARRGAPNERLGHGNTLHELPGALGADAAFVEYHVPGTEQYGGMDWGSLRLVFAPHAGAWRLVGLVHDQWTI
jgi:hypothetical protein